ncbi:hypothetical protein glysoja_041018 [Glycine soja]|uniref:Uncharacterized protein n=1 Tax=Glycine soja TaxID=3848 RepID=A0A0B2SLF0_GLYSO|nr:hypothetical protein glysoja_041018 [Glycine soja]
MWKQKKPLKDCNQRVAEIANEELQEKLRESMAQDEKKDMQNMKIVNRKKERVHQREQLTTDTITSPDNESVKCECIPSYIPLDNQDVSKECHPPTTIIYCVEKNFKLEVFEDTDFQFDTNCVRKRLSLLNARNSSSSKGQKPLLKVPNNEYGTSNKATKKKSFNVKNFFKVMIAVTDTLACFFGALVVDYHPFTQRLARRKQYLNASAIGINFREFTFQELHEAKDGFIRILGKGSSGKV